MSYKATAFSYTVVPKTISRFVVYVPEVYDSPIRVYSTRAPQAIKSVVPLPVAGQTINLPGKKQYPGSWECKVYESRLMDISQQVFLTKQLHWKDGLFIPVEPLIMLTDEMTGDVPIKLDRLKGAFLEGVSEPELDWSRPGTPLVWTLRFRYTEIESLTEIMTNTVKSGVKSAVNLIKSFSRI